MQRAIEDGTHAVPFGKWHTLPDDLSGVDHVRHEDQRSRIRIVVGDARVRVPRAELAG